MFGELDAAEVRSVKASLLGADGDIELDCSGLSFIDAAALGLFVQLDAECRARSAKLLLINPSQCVLDLVELAGLDSLLTTEAGEPTR
ncbi:MAG TPA: STAS domain-containing protein [Ilumatobacteraceae bacterium]